jgi:hypothetical protein
MNTQILQPQAAGRCSVLLGGPRARLPAGHAHGGGGHAFSIVTGTLFFIAFAAVASGNGSPAAILGLGAAILLAWIWHATLSWSLLEAQTRA